MTEEGIIPKTSPRLAKTILPQIVGSDWIMDRYGFSGRTLEKRIQDGTLKPFKLNPKANRFYAGRQPALA